MSTFFLNEHRPRAPRWVIVTLIALLTLVGVSVSVLSIKNWNFMRGALASALESKLDRPVSIQGDLRADLLSWYPEVTAHALVVGNPDAVDASALDESSLGNADFAKVDRIDLALDLRELFRGSVAFEKFIIDNPVVTLINQSDANNFTFAKRSRGESTRSESENGNELNEPNDDKPRDALPSFPAVRHFTLRGGELHVRDAVNKLTFDGQVEASEHASAHTDPFRLRGEGTLNEEPFSLLLSGGPLANIELDKPYEFDADVKAGKTTGKIRGAFSKPFDLNGVFAVLDVTGDNLAHLYYLTGLALPFTPPYKIAAEIYSVDRTIDVRSLNGQIGSSDIRGTINVDLRKDKPLLHANLTSKSLNLADLSPAVGKGVKVKSDGETLDSVAPGKLPDDKLLPTYRFEFDRLKAMDAKLKLHADSVQTQRIPITQVDIDLNLHNTILTLKSAVFTMPQGNISATARIDARQPTADNVLDLRINNVKLDQFKGKDMNEAPMDGVLHARLELQGKGNSAHELAVNGTGQFSVVVPSGELRKAFAELTGVNVDRGLGLLLSQNESRAGVRCGAAVLSIDKGQANIDTLVVDTDNVLIEGEGHIDLAAEELNIDIEGEPKKVRLVRLRTPITLTGPIRKPSLGVDKSDTAKQVGIAGALATIFSPLAAALAFIDPGLAKDANCAALLSEAQGKQQPTANQALDPADPATKTPSAEMVSSATH